MTRGIRKIYSEVAHTYELVNHVLTLGYDIRWRRRAARMAAELGGSRWLDICSGTGEMAEELDRRASNGVGIVAADLSYPMLSRARDKRSTTRVTFTLTESETLPFPDSIFDLVTISFATRNVNRDPDTFRRHLREYLRVLKPGGHFVNLETSQPTSRLLRSLFHTYIAIAVKPVGVFFSGSKAGYSYLSHTIPRFYNADELSATLLEAGFAHVDAHRMLAGVAAIHTATK